MDETNEEIQHKHFRENYVRMVAIFLAMMAVPLIGYSLWDQYFGTKAHSAAEQYQVATKTYEDAMRADTYGGKTPEETLNMLISALKAGDIATAGLYFELEQNPQDPNYLTRKKWEDELTKAAQENRLNGIASLLSLATPDVENRTDENDYKFQIMENGKLEGYVNMKLNTFSNVWKIESL